ncbi:hypothetical protein G3435_25295, partial [Pseudomonas sp. MAFF212428]|nr:hypothetical protein [Pseudomonas brassicae]
MLRQVDYRNTSQDPLASGEQANIRVTLDDGEANRASLEVNIALTGVNDPAVIDSSVLDPTLVEDGEFVKLFKDTSIDTVEAGQTLWQVVLTLDGKNTNDVIRVGTDKIALRETSGVQKTANGLEYMVYYANGNTVLIIYPAGDGAHTAALIDTLAYNNTGTGLSGTRTVSLGVVENLPYGGIGPDSSTFDTKVTITLAPASEPNTAPVLGNTGSAPHYVEGGAPVLIAPGAVISDAQMDRLGGGKGNYQGATLTVGLGHPSSTDTFGFTAGNGLSLQGNTLFKDGVAIASVTQRDGQFIVKFNDDAGLAPSSSDVQNTLRQITYASSSHNPGPGDTLSVTLSDLHLTSSVLSIALSIEAVNDAPVVAADPL